MGRFHDSLVQEEQLAKFRHELNHFYERMKIMFEDLKAAVAAESSAVQAAVVMLKGLADKVAALSPNATDIAALAAQIRTDTAALANATVANTPSAPDASPAV